MVQRQVNLQSMTLSTVRVSHGAVYRAGLTSTTRSTPNRSGQWAAGAAVGVLRLLLLGGQGLLEVLDFLITRCGVLYQHYVHLLHICHQVQELLWLCEGQLEHILKGDGGAKLLTLKVQ